ncbi:MAG: hypothetical protein ACJA02_000353 [Myxococcota bacterium]|jgi:hypothetical protein
MAEFYLLSSYFRFAIIAQAGKSNAFSHEIINAK